MNKTLITILTLTLMLTTVSATRVISDLDSGITIASPTVYAGSPIDAMFSFNYLQAQGINLDNSPLVIQLNITSSNTSFPVNKDEFVVSGHIEKYSFFGLIPLKDVQFTCSEEEEQIIDSSLGGDHSTALNGTFYCYNPEGDLNLNEHDQVYLSITSHPAIWPGQYDLTAQLFYLEDETNPFVNILNKADFDLFYRENDKVSIEVNVTDASSISQVYAIADLSTDTINFDSYHTTGTVYSFQENTPSDIAEDNYTLTVYAKDEYGNEGTDTVTLRIDTTAPTITMLKPDGSIYSDMLPIEMEITDTKSGVDSSSVTYRLSGDECKIEGEGSIDCYDAGWQPLPYDETRGTYYAEVDITGTDIDSGDYWIMVHASDILGNQGVLE